MAQLRCFYYNLNHDIIYFIPQLSIIVDVSKVSFVTMRKMMEETERKNEVYQNSLNQTDGELFIDVKPKLYDDEEVEEMFKQILEYFRIGCFVVALVIQLY